MFSVKDNERKNNNKVKILPIVTWSIIQPDLRVFYYENDTIKSINSIKSRLMKKGNCILNWNRNNSH